MLNANWNIVAFVMLLVGILTLIIANTSGTIWGVFLIIVALILMWIPKSFGFDDLDILD